VFSVRYVPRYYKEDNEESVIRVSELLVGVLVRELLQFSLCEKLVAEAGDRSGTQRKGNVRSWKSLSSNGSEDVTVDTSACEIVNCKV
jgi:hypothetical protein